MGERARASEALLAEIGWLTIQWARLEGYVDLVAAYIHKRLESGSTSLPPAAFNARLKYIRKALLSHAFINLCLDGHNILERANAASRQRNDLVHGIVTSWVDHSSATKTTLKRSEQGYIAIQDRGIDIERVEKLCREIWAISVDLFHFVERVKAILSFLNGDRDFWITATMAPTYD